MNLIAGFSVGHWTNADACTGCTVILCPPSTVASCEVRGSSPGSRELALLAPDKKLNEVHALLLTGGSAFGLAAADGVVRWLEEHDRGYQTPWGKVPIVPAAVIFDLNLGPWNVRPGPAEGYAACESATNDIRTQGNIGAGCGATVGKWNGMENRMKGGFGCSEVRKETLIVQACAIVNAVGDVLAPDGTIIAGARTGDGGFAATVRDGRMPAAKGTADLTNTTLVAIMTNARLDKRDCFRVTQRVHDGFARAIVPVHTSYDGDVSFVLSNGNVEADLDMVAEESARVAAEAIRNAVTAATPLAGVPAARG